MMRNTPTSATPGTVFSVAATKSACPFQFLEVGADDLDRVLALDARHGFHHVVADVLREIPAHADQAAAQFLIHRRHDLFFGAGACIPGGTGQSSRGFIGT